MSATTYGDVQRWLKEYRVPASALTDEEMRAAYCREARERVLKFRDHQIREIFARAAKAQPDNRFLVSLASAVVSATDEELDLLRPATLVFIERLHL